MIAPGDGGSEGGEPEGGGEAATVLLDLCGLKCPLPAMRTGKALALAAPGTVLTVTCTDPLAAVDIPHLVAGSGHEITAASGDGRVLTFVIRVGQADQPEA